MLRKRLNKQEVIRRRPRVSSLLIWIFNFSLPIVLLLLVRGGLIELAILAALVSKWRIFAVQPRHWLANLRSNSTDIIVKLSTLTFMVRSVTLPAQLAWTAWYIVWLLVIKRRSDTTGMGAQAWAGVVLGLSALFQFTDQLSEPLLIIGAWVVAVYTCRHFLNNYDEPYARPISFVWGLVIAQLAWVTFRWSLRYLFVSQLAIIAGVLAFTAGSLYHLQQTERLNRTIVTQQLGLAGAIMAFIILTADWEGAGF